MTTDILKIVILIVANEGEMSLDYDDILYGRRL